MYFVCDGVSIEFFVMNMGELLLPFIQNSDVLVINNCNNENNMKLENGIKLLEDLNHRAQIIKSKDKCNFDLALEQSNLLEGKFIRNIKMKIKEYMRK
jgi:G3E family GTPase